MCELLKLATVAAEFMGEKLFMAVRSAKCIYSNIKRESATAISDGDKVYVAENVT